MKMNRIFAALCAIVALGVSCQKEMTVKTDAEEIIVPEGMKYVSFEVGAPTKINGNPVKWNSSSESVAVLAILNGESVVYQFNSKPHYSETDGKYVVWPTTAIEGLVDEGAILKFVTIPYNEGQIIDLERDPDGNTLSFPRRLSYDYANPGIASRTPYACKIQYIDGVYSAKTNLQPLCSFLKVTLPVRKSDHIKGSSDKDTSLADSLYITGNGIAGKTYVDFSGDEAVTSLADEAKSQTLKVVFKINTTSGLPTAGEYLVPIVPGVVPSLDFKVTYTPGSDNIEYSDYSVNYGANTFKQGAYKNLTICAPYVTSATTVSATVEGTTLSMAGSAVFYTGGKVTASNYIFGFKYREKDTEAWTSETAVFADNKFTASITIDPSKTYEVKAFATAPGAIKQPAADQTVEGNIKESGAEMPPIVVTIDGWGAKQYDGTNGGGHFKYVGTDPDYSYPTVKGDRNKKTDAYDYYADVTDTTPLISGVTICSTSTNGMKFSSSALLNYSGWISFPAKSGYKVTKVVCTVSSGSNMGKTINATPMGTSEPLWESNAYESANVHEDLAIDCSGLDNDGIKIHHGAAWNFFKIAVTYTAI